MTELNRWFERDKGRADFRVVYIAEAHATDGRQAPKNVRDGILIATHRTFEEREKAARQLRDELGLKLPIVIDEMSDTASRAYSAWPDRIFIVDKDGRIAYRGAPGPAGFNPGEAERALAKVAD